MKESEKQKKEAMKKLRNTRKEWIAKALANVKEQRKALKAIRAHLKEGAETIPMIAEATGIPSDRVLWYIATLKKYGEISENQKDGTYFRYVLEVKGEEEDHLNRKDKPSESV